MTLTPRALYVEFDHYAAAWLRNLISRDVIAAGDVYCGDVRDCRPQDLARYNQVHLYAGVGVWSYGLRRAGIPDSANIWTFSEPCQPFSQAGKGLGFADERYLRPFTHHLVEQCRPAICLGEQVASGDGLAWLDVVQSDMERARYAGGASDTCSAGFGAPHIRQRLRIAYASAEWLADADGTRRASRREGFATLGHGSTVGANCGAGGMANADHNRLQGRPEQTLLGTGRRVEGDAAGHNSAAGPTNGFWSDADWLYCRDGKWRPVEPGTFPLAHGASSRVGRLRAYGNAVDGEATTEFCRAVVDVMGL